MIVIKKKLSAKSGASLKAKLKDYFELSKNKNAPSKGSIIKASLKSVIPLAAASIIPGQQLSAQCWTTGTGPNSQSLVGGCFYAFAGPFGLDVDGDGSFDFGWGAQGNVSTLYTGTTTSTGGVIQRNFIINAATSFYMFGIGGGMVGPTPIPVSSIFTCDSNADLTTGTAFFFQAAGLYNGVQTYPVGGTAWNTVSFTTISTSSTGSVPTGPYSFPISSAAGACGWVELTYGFGPGGTIMCFDSGGVEDAGGGDDGVGTVHMGECESLADAVLPVQLVNFSARTLEREIELNWNTLGEINNNGFEVQRSTDGVSFHKIGFVNGKLNSSKEETYNFVDSSVQNNITYYYRLKQIDVNGAFELSEIVNAVLNKSDQFSASKFYPNPVSNDEVYIDINLIESGKLSFEVFDAYGKKVHVESVDGKVGLNKISLQLHNMNSGTYFVKILAGDKSRYGKLIKL